MSLEWIKFGKPSMLGIVTGMVAGLGTITPASGFVGPGGALWVKTNLVGGLARFDASGWTTFDEADGLQRWGQTDFTAAVNLKKEEAPEAAYWLVWLLFLPAIVADVKHLYTIVEAQGTARAEAMDDTLVIVFLAGS